MQKIGIDGERRLAALVLGDRDLVLFGEFEEGGAAREVPFAPRRDHGDVGLQGIIGELEAHLVIPLAGRPVRDRVGAGLLGDLDLLLRRQGAGNGSAQEIKPLILRIGAKHREDVIAREFLAHVLDEDVFRLDAEKNGFLACALQFLALAEIGREGHDLAAIGAAAAISK